MMPPSAGLKFALVLSTLAEVHAPVASRCGVMYRLPLRTSTLLGSFVMRSISPVPNPSGPPSYFVPSVSNQLLELGRPLPVKSSRKVVSQEGAAAATGPDVTTPKPTAETTSEMMMASGLDRPDIVVPSVDTGRWS